MKNLFAGDTSALDVPTIDLNELIFDHPAASFLFNLNGNLLVIDRALTPNRESLVLVESEFGYSLEPYIGQDVWGVATYLLKKIS